MTGVEARARRMEEALREALHVLQQIPDRQRSKRHKCAIGKARAALSDSPAAEPVAGQSEATWIDILREWFGGERYARDHEYLDANFRPYVAKAPSLRAVHRCI